MWWFVVDADGMARGGARFGVVFSAVPTDWSFNFTRTFFFFLLRVSFFFFAASMNQDVGSSPPFVEIWQGYWWRWFDGCVDVRWLFCTTWFFCCSVGGKVLATVSVCRIWICRIVLPPRSWRASGVATTVVPPASRLPLFVVHWGERQTFEAAIWISQICLADRTRSWRTLR